MKLSKTKLRELSAIIMAAKRNNCSLVDAIKTTKYYKDYDFARYLQYREEFENKCKEFEFLEI